MKGSLEQPVVGPGERESLENETRTRVAGLLDLLLRAHHAGIGESDEVWAQIRGLSAWEFAEGLSGWGLTQANQVEEAWHGTLQAVLYHLGMLGRHSDVERLMFGPAKVTAGAVRDALDALRQ